MGFFREVASEIGTGLKRSAVFFVSSVLIGAAAGAIWGLTAGPGLVIGAAIGATAGAVVAGVLLWFVLTEA